MLIILLLRIAITATFFILAAGGPYAIILLRRFIARYTVAHTELEIRTAALERRIAVLERQAGMSTPGPNSNEG